MTKTDAYTAILAVELPERFDVRCVFFAPSLRWSVDATDAACVDSLVRIIVLLPMRLLSGRLPY